MELRQEVAERTSHMVAHCRLDSASIFLTERSAATANLIHLHHVGISEDVKRAYSQAGVYQDDPFITATRAGMCSQGENWYEWSDNRLDPHKAGATRYVGFIDNFAIDVVAAYVKALTPDLYLLIGTHRRCGTGKRRVRTGSNATLRGEVDIIARLVMAQMFEETLQHPGAAAAFCQRIGGPSGGAGHDAGAATDTFHLSRREQEIAQLICSGKQNKEIAYVTGLSGYTVENHLRRIFSKAGVHNRAALVARMLQQSH